MGKKLETAKKILQIVFLSLDSVPSVTRKSSGKIFFVVALVIAVLSISSSIQAEEYFFDNGLYVGLSASATHVTRDKKINYASSGPQFDSLSPFEVKIKDWAVSPSVTIGYKLDDSNSLSLRGGWSRYSLSRSFTSASRFFAVGTVNGGASVIVDGAGVDISIDWKSDVANLGLEYQRKLWSDNLGAVLGFLGFRYRYESQNFDGISSVLLLDMPPRVFTFDATREQLREHLYGPYTGLKFSFKPTADSRLGITLMTSIGWLFKNADLQARNAGPSFLPPFSRSIARNDHSSQGTVVTDVGLKVSYSISKNVFANVGYKFDWISKAAHISSPLSITIFDALPARIVDTSVLTQSIGFEVSYRF